jgi:hypothetical protein
MAVGSELRASEEGNVKPIVRRLQQLERVQRAHSVAKDASGAKEALLESVNRLGERLRSDPNWVEPTAEEMEQIDKTFWDSIERLKT